MMTLKSFRGDVKRISVVIPMLLAAFTANAQQPWTLDDCLQYARENNIDLQKREIEVELSKNSLNTAKNDWLPTIEFTAAQQFSFGNASASTGVMATEPFDANLSYTSGSLNVEMPLFDGFLRKNRQRSADWSVKEAVASLDHAHKNLTIQVATYYLQVLYEQGMAEVAEAQVEASRRLCEKTHALVEDGKSPK
ncbi:MAG: TolC family protein, partial [Bacteroidaceae bacterium]|nr:TolC family protein [Bacteroidaceae bacterium]